MTSTVQVYPTPAGAARSDGFAVLAGDSAPFVERWQDVSYARFAIAGNTPIEIRTPAAARDVRVLPPAAVSDLRTDGDRIRFTLLRPANLAVLSAGMERLFLLVDPVEAERPVPGTPGVVSVAAHGADPTGTTVATKELQAAIDEVAARPGGGTVVVPEGTFLTGTLTIRSHVTLYLAPGAVLRGSPDPADYPIDPGRHESGSDTSIESPDERYRGDTMTFSRLLLFDGAEDAHLVGRGTIDGNGSYLRKARNAVPNLIRVRRGHDITIRDVLLRDAAAWTVHVLGARRATIENVKIVNDRSNLNTDGIDPDASQDVTIRGCLIYTKDDGVCVKATNNSGLGGDVERVEVTGNVVSSLDAALKVGSESQAALVRDVVFRDNDVFDSGRAMCVVVRDGATYTNVVFRDIRVAPWVSHLVEQVIAFRKDSRPTLGRIERLTFENVEVAAYRRPASNRTWYVQFRPGGENAGDIPVFQGADARHALSGLVLRNVVVNGVRLQDRATADRVANLTIGPFVDDVTIE